MGACANFRLFEWGSENSGRAKIREGNQRSFRITVGISRPSTRCRSTSRRASSNVRGACQKPAGRRLERVPIEWNHLSDKDAARSQRVGACKDMRWAPQGLPAASPSKGGACRSQGNSRFGERPSSPNHEGRAGSKPAPPASRFSPSSGTSLGLAAPSQKSGNIKRFRAVCLNRGAPLRAFQC